MPFSPNDGDVMIMVMVMRGTRYEIPRNGVSDLSTIIGLSFVSGLGCRELGGCLGDTYTNFEPSLISMINNIRWG